MISKKVHCLISIPTKYFSIKYLSRKCFEQYFDKTKENEYDFSFSDNCQPLDSFLIPAEAKLF